MDGIRPVAVVGIGELGGVLSRALLAVGHPVYPVLRTTDREALARFVDPELVVVAVAEADLEAALRSTPSTWRDRLVLLQNELVPATWQRHAVSDPTVLVVWFEKKPGHDAHVVLPSVAAGRHASVMVQALAKLELPARIVERGDDLVLELALKNLYILTTNIAGLRSRGSVAELWSSHQELAIAVAEEVLAIQERLVDRALPRDDLIARMLAAFDADPGHRCAGRSAPARLARAVEHAVRFDLDAPTLRAILAQQRVAS